MEIYSTKLRYPKTRVWDVTLYSHGDPPHSVQHTFVSPFRVGFKRTRLEQERHQICEFGEDAT